MVEPGATAAAGAAPQARAAGAPADPIWDDWDTPLQAPRTPLLHLDGYTGPMDLLLELAERQRIDLGRLSVVALAEQFAAECEAMVGTSAGAETL